MTTDILSSATQTGYSAGYIRGAATVKVRDLLNAMKALRPIIQTRNTVPVLSTVLFEIDASHLRLTATDLDQALIRSIAAEDVTPLRACVPFDNLVRVLKAAPSNSTVRVRVTTTDREYSGKTITQWVIAFDFGHFRCNILSMPPEDFPTWHLDGTPPRMKGDRVEDARPAALVLASDLRRVIKTVGPFQSQEETRYYLNGIYFHREKVPSEQDPKIMIPGQNIVCVATDGHRLCVSTMCNSELPLEKGEIVPSKGIASIYALTAGLPDDAMVKWSWLPNNMAIRIETQDRTKAVVTKLIDGTYPDYKRVVPKVHCMELTVSQTDIRSASAMVATLTSRDNTAVKLTITEEAIRLETSSVHAGTSEADLRGHATRQADDGQILPLVIGFNANYLVQALDVFKCAETVSIKFDKPSVNPFGKNRVDHGPVTITADGINATHVIMPMRMD